MRERITALRRQADDARRVRRYVAVRRARRRLRREAVRLDRAVAALDSLESGARLRGSRRRRR